VPALINEGNFEAVAMFTVFFVVVLFDVSLAFLSLVYD
jgi:hypothetical protein